MTEENTAPKVDLIGLTVDIVAAYVRNNTLPMSELPRLIADTHAAIAGVSAEPAPGPAEEKQVPAVTIRKSVTPDFLICLEDGRKFKTLKRHLATHYDLTPDQYRQKWNLPEDYPMVAPNYSATRAALAKAAGLGRKVALSGERAAEQETATAPRKKLGLKFT